MSNHCGMCVWGSDVGVVPASGDMVAYAHPLCPEHGDGCEGYVPGERPDAAGRYNCANCLAYEDEHYREGQ